MNNACTFKHSNTCAALSGTHYQLSVISDFGFAYWSIVGETSDYNWIQLGKLYEVFINLEMDSIVLIYLGNKQFCFLYPVQSVLGLIEVHNFMTTILSL